MARLLRSLRRAPIVTGATISDPGIWVMPIVDPDCTLPACVASVQRTSGERRPACGRRVPADQVGATPAHTLCPCQRSPCGFYFGIPERRSLVASASCIEHAASATRRVGACFGAHLWSECGETPRSCRPELQPGAPARAFRLHGRTGDRASVQRATAFQPAFICAGSIMTARSQSGAMRSPVDPASPAGNDSAESSAAAPKRADRVPSVIA